MNKLGLNASAGVGVAEKVCMIIMLVPIAFMQSMSAYVAQNYGAKRIDRAVKGLRVSILVSVAFGAVLGSLAFFRGDLLCAIFARDEGVIAAGFEYLRAYGIDCLLTSFLFCFVGCFNGLGKTGFVMIEGIISAFAVLPRGRFCRRRLFAAAAAAADGQQQDGCKRDRQDPDKG